MADGRAVYAIATMDTKGRELEYVAERLRAEGAAVVVADVGVHGPAVGQPDVPRETVAGRHPDGRAAVLGLADRGDAVTRMGEALVAWLAAEHAAGRVAGVIALGGSGGTALVAPALQALPIGLPKLIVSTMASGNVRPYVGCADVAMMYSVVDVAGLNRVSRTVLANAAAAMAGMARRRPDADVRRPTVGMTMFGVTTPCVTALRERLEADGVDCLVFHATGSGGQAMEQLVRDGLIDAVLDVTTTEVADEIAGGVLSAGPGRGDAIAASGVPWVMSLGALDMANFGAKETVPPQFAGRKLHVHNAQVTLMRTTPDENRRIAEFLAAKINRTTGPFRLLIPELGVSALDAPGKPFHDPEANAALFDELERRIEPAPNRGIRRLPLHINDPAFAAALADAYREAAAARRQP